MKEMKKIRKEGLKKDIKNFKECKQSEWAGTTTTV